MQRATAWRGWSLTQSCWKGGRPATIWFAIATGGVGGPHISWIPGGAPQIADTGALLDIGSGAGLPGVPLLIARPGWRGVLLEPRQKRWAFLRLVVRELGLECTVERSRYQDLGASRQLGPDYGPRGW